jgi:hypothetical protein
MELNWWGRVFGKGRGAIGGNINRIGRGLTIVC